MNNESMDKMIDFGVATSKSIERVRTNDPTIFEKNIKSKLRLFLHKFRGNKIGYDFYWEDEAEKFYNEIKSESEKDDFIDNDKYNIIILDQTLLDASFIDMSEYGEIEFPWHENTEAEFDAFNSKLQNALPEILKAKTKKDVIRIKKKYKSIYEAYFLSPIKVSEASDGGKYPLCEDGRHRVYAAQKAGNKIPVWIIRWVDITKMNAEQFKKLAAYGEWRFYDFDMEAFDINQLPAAEA